MNSRDVVTSVLSVIVTLLVSHALHAQGQEEASRVYLNQSLFHLRQAQLYADRSVQTLPLSGFDYVVFQRDLDTVADGVETFLHPRPGDPVRVVPVEIDGHYLAEELVREGKTLEEIGGVEPEEDGAESLPEASEPGSK